MCGWGKTIVPADLGHRTTGDAVELSVRNSPRWALGMPQAYDRGSPFLYPAVTRS